MGKNARFCCMFLCVFFAENYLNLQNCKHRILLLKNGDGCVTSFYGNRSERALSECVLR